MMVQTVKSSNDNIEKDSLAVHVEMCAHRYAVLEARVTELERKVEDIKNKADDARRNIIETVGKAAAIISVVVSITLILLDKFK